MPSTASSLSSTAVMSKTPSLSSVNWVSIAETAASGPTTAMVTSSGSAVTAGHEKASTITAMIAVNPVAMASVRRIGVCGRSAPDGDSVVVSDMRSLHSNLCSKNLQLCVVIRADYNNQCYHNNDQYPRYKR